VFSHLKRIRDKIILLKVICQIIIDSVAENREEKKVYFPR